MATTPFTATGTASDILTLSKAAWKLGSSLTKLDQDSKVVESAVKQLADDARSLSTECDLVHAELEEVTNKIETGIPPPYTVDGRIWNCLVEQVEETRISTQELERFVQLFREDKSSVVRQTQNQWRLDEKKVQIAEFRTQLCRHTDNFRTTSLLIKT
jgi:hypothetical protein